MTNEPDQNTNTTVDKTVDKSKESTPMGRVEEIPKIIQATLKQKLDVVKTSAQKTYNQVLDKATETVDHIDSWAVDQVNENLDKVAETVDRSRQEAQAKLQKGLKHTQSTIQEKAKNTGDRLKNTAQSVLKKLKDQL
ncbi:hypothetical protein [Synechococcus sp. PCC 7502]|uniref:hypothetical protein n=1 Tax=Synechococcus sp. PCC 7502 TaxID=1173263 RepID=UPI00059EC95B|nr:hypothetical protein [Synechococcus sp. PCC 7502]